MTHCVVECSILNVYTIFDNTFDGAFPQNSMWTAPWNPYGMGLESTHSIWNLAGSVKTSPSKTITQKQWQTPQNEHKQWPTHKNGCHPQKMNHSPPPPPTTAHKQQPAPMNGHRWCRLTMRDKGQWQWQLSSLSSFYIWYCKHPWPLSSPLN